MSRYAYFPALCVSMGLPKPVTEHKFHPTRKWRFDFAVPEHLVAIEVDGAIWTQGRHTRGSGRIKDMEKQTAAAVLGWRILYFTPDQLMTTATIQAIKQAVAFKL